MLDFQRLGIRQFLRDHPRMAIRPTLSDNIRLIGHFDFAVELPEHGVVTTAFELCIDIPAIFPRDLPAVAEIGKRIPRDGNHHINAGDDTLCLGSRLRLLSIVASDPTLFNFCEKCLVPYLIAVEIRLTTKTGFIFGELPHGSQGEFEDYVELLGLATPEQAEKAVQYLGLKKRKANRLPCPCECGRRLGRCEFNFTINRFRRMADRTWFRKLMQADRLSSSRIEKYRYRTATIPYASENMVAIATRKKLSGKDCSADRVVLGSSS